MSKAAYLSPSLACCPLERLEAHVRELEQLGADLLHVDIMDGDFVANYCLGTEFVPLLHRITRLPLDIHLMVQRPEQKIAYFALAPRDFVTVHAESTPHVHKALAAIRAQGARAGLALNPATPLEACRWVLDDLDLLLIMTINPGFAGQKLVAQTLEKLRSAREMLDAAGSAALLAVDGNVSFENAKTMSQCGAARGAEKAGRLAKGRSRSTAVSERPGQHTGRRACGDRPEPGQCERPGPGSIPCNRFCGPASNRVPLPGGVPYAHRRRTVCGI